MITKKAEYAVIILAELASHPKGAIVTSKEIAEKRLISVNLVVQLLSLLKEAGWTSGTRGPSGGIRLVADPAAITLKDVIEKVDGPIGITRCLFSDKPCGDRTHCSLRGIWSKAQQSMLDVLEEATIQELAKTAISDC
ncbi:MAG: RrF2 family transcriptional regulator [Dethiobacteria bacterium]|nr:Rrf2 family transcriptional regulator [Bacillota bacterium]